MSSIPEESLIGGSPAKLLSTGIRRVEKNEVEINQYFRNHPNENVFSFALERKNEFV